MEGHGLDSFLGLRTNLKSYSIFTDSLIHQVLISFLVLYQFDRWSVKLYEGYNLVKCPGNLLLFIDKRTRSKWRETSGIKD